MNRKYIAGDVIEHRILESIQGVPVTIPHPTGLTHLQFRRFAGCPICNLVVQSFIRRHDELVSHGIQVISVFHSSNTAMLKYQSEAPFPLIADPSKMLYKEFGVEPSIASVLNPLAWFAGIKGVFRHGVGLPARGESVLGLPGDFLIESSGKILGAKYGGHAYDQWTVDELLEHARSANHWG